MPAVIMPPALQKDGDRMNALLHETKANKLAHYAKRDLKRFLQYDGFDVRDRGDDLMRPDEDGHWISSGLTNELMTGYPAVRVLISHGADKEQVVAMLLKIACYIQADDDGTTRVFLVTDPDDPFPAVNPIHQKPVEGPDEFQAMADELGGVVLDQLPGPPPDFEDKLTDADRPPGWVKYDNVPF